MQSYWNNFVLPLIIRSVGDGAVSALAAIV